MSKKRNDLDELLVNYGKQNHTANGDTTPKEKVVKGNKSTTTDRTANALKTRSNVTIKVTGRHKVKVTKREGFEITLDLKKKLDDYIKANGANKSEFIRRAIAKELNKVNKR